MSALDTATPSDPRIIGCSYNKSSEPRRPAHEPADPGHDRAPTRLRLAGAVAASLMRPSGRGERPGEEGADIARDGVELAFQQEMAALDEPDLSPGRVVGERERPFVSEDLVVAPPDGEQRNAALAQVG